MLPSTKHALIFLLLVYPLWIICSGADMPVPQHPDKHSVLAKADAESGFPHQPEQKRFFSPGEVPRFLTAIPSDCNRCYPGISDPGLDSARAVNQALQRAAIFHALTKDTDIHFITDFYTKRIHQKTWEVFVHLFEVSLELEPMKADSVMVNQFGEAVVLASPNRKLLSDKQNIVVSGFIQEKSYGMLSDYMYRFEIKDPLKSVFLARLVNDKYSIETTSLSGEEGKYPLYNYHYTGNVDNDSSWHSHGFPLNSGLWPAVFGSVMKSLFFHAKETADYEAGNMRDSYSEQLNARLKRQTGNNTFTMSFAGCEIYRNHITPLLAIETKK